jgi:hypothetical protein
MYMMWLAGNFLSKERHPIRGRANPRPEMPAFEGDIAQQNLTSPQALPKFREQCQGS